jgi:hypothetical protein
MPSAKRIWEASSDHDRAARRQGPSVSYGKVEAVHKSRSPSPRAPSSA